MDRSSLVWRKSRASGGGHGCVEVAFADTPVRTRHSGGCLIMVRDSKNPDGPVLTVAGAAWQALLTSIKNGRLDLG
jgi:hypothetical protein